MFKITAYYQTGNSFGSEYTSDELGVVLNDLEEAKDCLRRAKEHYLFVKDLENTHSWDNRPGMSRDKLIKINKDKDWFFPDYPEAGFIFKDRRVSAYYIGYFEILHKLQIEYIDTEDDDLVFEP